MCFLDFDLLGFLPCHQSSTLFLRESQACESHPMSDMSGSLIEGGSHHASTFSKVKTKGPEIRFALSLSNLEQNGAV